jgi:hypothetical protein
VANVRVDMHHGAIFRLLHSPAGPVHRKVSSVLRKAEAIAVATAPVDTGRLKNDRTADVRDEAVRLRGRLEFQVNYAWYVVKGTGIYGPRRRPITPKNAEVLVFRVGGQVVFARQVKGQKPNPFLVNALKAASPWPVIEH